MMSAMAWAQPAPDRLEAITKPSRDVTMSFVRAGKIAKFLVKEGDWVKLDAPLVQLDDEAEQIQLAQLKAQADDKIRVDAADAQLAQKVNERDRTKNAYETSRSATELQVQQAELDVKIADLSLQLSKFEREQAVRKYDEAKSQVARMRLNSPVEGRVERFFVQEGESVDALAKVIRVVQIDPLHIEVPVPRCGVNCLKTGQEVQVLFDRGEGSAQATGKITYVAAVGDAASETLMVRVEVANKDRRPAGEHVIVQFPAVGNADSSPKAPVGPLESKAKE